MTRPASTRPRDNRPAARPSWKSVTAAAATKRPTTAPITWFRNPQLQGPTAITVTDDGRFWGHGALWGSNHLGMARPTPPPHDRHGYSQYHRGALDVFGENGEKQSIAVGLVCMNGDHASDAPGVSASAARNHYADTTTIAAYARAGEDTHGVWLAGQVDPDLDEVNLRRFKACGVSGDWRSLTSSGSPDALVGMLAVPTCGFPVPRGVPGSRALVAAGAVPSQRDHLIASAAKRKETALDLYNKASRARTLVEQYRELSWEKVRSPEQALAHEASVRAYTASVTDTEQAAQYQELLAFYDELDAARLP